MAAGRYTIEFEVEADLENNLLPSRREIQQLVFEVCKIYNLRKPFYENYERLAIIEVTVTDGPIRTG